MTTAQVEAYKKTVESAEVLRVLLDEEEERPGTITIVLQQCRSKRYSRKTMEGANFSRGPLPFFRENSSRTGSSLPPSAHPHIGGQNYAQAQHAAGVWSGLRIPPPPFVPSPPHLPHSVLPVVMTPLQHARPPSVSTGPDAHVPLPYSIDGYGGEDMSERDQMVYLWPHVSMYVYTPMAYVPHHYAQPMYAMPYASVGTTSPHTPQLFQQ